VILADTNFWLALSLSKHDFHQAAHEWFDAQSTAGSVLFCRSTQQSFLRLLTTDGVMRLYGIPPLANAAAWAVYDGFRADRRCGFVKEPGDIEAPWKRYASRGSTSPKLWMDAYLAAFATAAGHRVVTTDKGFKQFKDLDSIILSKF
jgi:toxin-antitoxin system PIN domain toxin